jgi:hypothetical protein
VTSERTDPPDVEPLALTKRIEIESAESPSSRLIARAPPPHDVSALWYVLVSRPWTSLAVVSPDDGSKAWRLAERFLEVARQNQSSVFTAVNILNLNVERAASIAHAVSVVTAVGQRKRFVMAIDSPLENPIAIRVLSACDAVLLLLEKGRSRIPDAQRTVELVGRERLIGAVLGSS